MTDDGYDRCDECGRRTAHMPGCPQGQLEDLHADADEARPTLSQPPSPWQVAAKRLEARQPYNDPWQDVTRDDYLAAVRRFSQKAIRVSI